MDKRWQNLGGIILAIFFVSQSLAKAENTADPTDNVNLSPIQAWRSAYYCLHNVSTGREISPAFTTFSMSGWLNVTSSEGQSFCTGGCAAHTRDVLLCLEHVKKDFYFANKATIGDLNETINNGCSRGFTGVSLYQSHGYRFSSTPVFASLSAAVAYISSASGNFKERNSYIAFFFSHLPLLDSLDSGVLIHHFRCRILRMKSNDGGV